MRKMILRVALMGSLLAIMTITGFPASAQSAPDGGPVIWRFDQTSSLGGHPTKILGHPQVIQTPYGKAIHFNGVDDALFVGVHPLAGARTWT